jgi:acetyl-CoA synthase
MVKELIQLGISGAENILASAEKLFAYTLDERGGDTAIAFPDTAFYLPFAYAFLGEEIGRVRDLQTALDAAKQLVERNGDKTVEKALDAGMAALLASEIIAVIRFLEKEEPQQDCEGFFTDSLLRSLGLQLAGGKMAGIALIIGSAPDAPSAATLVREFQEKNILTLAGGNSKGTSIVVSQKFIA